MVRIVSVTVYGNQWSRDLIEDASGAHHVRRPPSCPPATGHALLTVGLPGTCRHCDRYTFAFAWRLAARASRARTPGRTLNGARLSRAYASCSSVPCVFATFLRLARCPFWDGFNTKRRQSAAPLPHEAPPSCRLCVGSRVKSSRRAGRGDAEYGLAPRAVLDGTDDGGDSTQIREGAQ
jgi:hypothetical protein